MFSGNEKIIIVMQLEICVLGTQARDPGGTILDVFRGDIIAEVAAKRERGLQLLLVDVCNTAKNVALPDTLRYLFLSIR